MSTEEFIKYLEKQMNKNAVLELKGIIETEVEIEEIGIKSMEKFLILQNKNIKKQKVILNLHQLMKITKLEENTILLEFDQLQTVTIKLFSPKENSFGYG